jgi:hypothetical protein
MVDSLYKQELFILKAKKESQELQILARNRSFYFSTKEPQVLVVVEVLQKLLA